MQLMPAHHVERHIGRADGLQAGSFGVAVASAMVEFRRRFAAMCLNGLVETPVRGNVFV